MPQAERDASTNKELPAFKGTKGPLVLAEPAMFRAHAPVKPAQFQSKRTEFNIMCK